MRPFGTLFLADTEDVLLGKNIIREVGKSGERGRFPCNSLLQLHHIITKNQVQ